MSPSDRKEACGGEEKKKPLCSNFEFANGGQQKGERLCERTSHRKKTRKFLKEKDHTTCTAGRGKGLHSNSKEKRVEQTPTEVEKKILLKAVLGRRWGRWTIKIPTKTVGAEFS